MKTSPSFSFYASDFILGTMLMSAEEVGAYIRLLCWQWEQGELPSDLEKLSRICGVSQKKLSGVLVKFRVTESGGYINNRLEEVREQREHFIEIQRLNGKKGGRPKKAMENPRVMNGLTQSEPEKTLPSPSPSPSPIPILLLDADAPAEVLSKPSKPKKESAADPRFTVFRDIFINAYEEATGTPYAFQGGKDGKALSQFLKTFKDVDEAAFHHAINWCREVAGGNAYAAGCVRQTSNLAAFCSSWNQIVEYFQTYKEPTK